VLALRVVHPAVAGDRSFHIWTAFDMKADWKKVIAFEL
jgi:hypothetical protein